MAEASATNSGGLARLRRSTRTPAKTPTRNPVETADSVPQTKRKAKVDLKSPEEQLEYLLTNTKSQLTKVDISVSGPVLASRRIAAKLTQYSNAERAQLQLLPGTLRRGTAPTVLAPPAHCVLDVQALRMPLAPRLPVTSAIRRR